MSIGSRGYRILCRLYSFVLGRLRLTQAWERCPIACHAAYRAVEPERLEPRLLLSGDMTPPVVSELLVAGTTWTPAFLSHLSSAGLGDGGFSVLGGAAQAGSVPWSNVNQVKVRFSEDVQVASGDLALRGINAPGGITVSDFSYDADSFTATWTFANPLAVDKWVFDVSDAIEDLAGNRLDGDWLNTADLFPSGDGTPGHDFKFQANVVRGDANRSGVVLGDDVILVRNAQFRDTTHPQYSPFLDLNGSGTILGDDVILARNAQFTTVPAGNHDLTGPSFAAGLANDTGQSASDGITSNAAVRPVKRQEVFTGPSGFDDIPGRRSKRAPPAEPAFKTGGTSVLSAENKRNAKWLSAVASATPGGCSKEGIVTVLLMLARLPLTDAERANAVRRLLSAP